MSSRCDLDELERRKGERERDHLPLPLKSSLRNERERRTLPCPSLFLPLVASALSWLSPGVSNSTEGRDCGVAAAVPCCTLRIFCSIDEYGTASGALGSVLTREGGH